LGNNCSDVTEPSARREVLLLSPTSEEAIMDKDRIDGAGKQVKGAIKDAAGKVTGDRKLQAEGKADKVVGKVQSEVGKAKDDVRNAALH
jgi:uncharacterized protein YjbJ (UPF0337 family)